MSAYMQSKQNFMYDQILRYIIPAVIEHDVGLANLEAEFCKPILLEEITAPVYIYMTLIYHVNRAELLHKRMFNKKDQTGQIVSGLK